MIKKFILFWIIFFGLLINNFCYGATSTIINITSDNISEMLSWTTTIIDNLKSVWLLIVGVLLGITIILFIIRAIRGKED